MRPRCSPGATRSGRHSRQVTGKGSCWVDPATPRRSQGHHAQNLKEPTCLLDLPNSKRPNASSSHSSWSPGPPSPISPTTLPRRRSSPAWMDRPSQSAWRCAGVRPSWRLLKCSRASTRSAPTLVGTVLGGRFPSSSTRHGYERSPN